jgi:hypothetical protein
VNVSVNSAATGSLLDRLRGARSARPQVDPELSGGLREWLEDALSDALSATSGGMPEGAPALVIDNLSRRRSLGAGELAEVDLQGSADETAVRRLVSCAFRQWVTTGKLGDPLADSLAAISVGGDPDGIVERVSRMPIADRAQLESEIARHAGRIMQTWPSLCASWRPRTNEKITIPLCGRRIILSAVVDLAVGPQASKNASVCIVGIETGPRRAADEIEMRFCALVETLRSGAPPSRVGRFYTRTGELLVEPVDEHLLVASLLETIELVERLCQ